MSKQKSNLEEIKEEYKKLEEKYKLPKFEEFDYEFEIRRIEIDKSCLLARDVLRAIIGRLGMFLNFLESAVSPPSSIHSAIESTNLAEDDRKGIFAFFKRLSYLYHLALVTELGNEEEICNYIKNIFNQWKEIKKEYRKHSEKISETWKKEIESEKTTYLG